jgi:hypothetical protein
MIYRDRRLHEAGITCNTFRYRDENFVEREGEYFATHKHGLEIFFPALDGEIETYYRSDVDEESPSGKTKYFSVIRYESPADGQPKYVSPKGAPARPLIHPRILEAANNNQSIDLLILVEGFFKGAALDARGEYAISMQGLRPTSKRNKDLHPRILEICHRTKPKAILLLHDGDARLLKAKPTAETDLAERFLDFYGAARDFKEWGLHLKSEKYYGQLRENLGDDCKGVDDLMQVHSPEKVIADLKLLAGSKQYFDIINLADTSVTGLQRRFYLNLTAGKPLEFCQRFDKELDGKEFRFKGGHFSYNSNGGVHVKVHPDAQLYFRAGCNYFKIQNRPESGGRDVEMITGWTKATIQDDYPSSDILKHIEKYEGFCNVPSHLEYQRKVQNYFNLYEDIRHKAMDEPGYWGTTKEFLQHIWGEKFDMGMDYITLLYRNPTQPLPILCLLSRENGTGKSTFLDFLKEIFGNNAAVLGNEDLKDRFNAHWITKLIIGIEEGFIDKRETKERLKSLSTAKSTMFHPKGTASYQVSFCGHFIINSNDEDYFVSVQEEETRWLVIKVPVIKKRDPALLGKLIDEIPAFLYELRTRDLVHKREDRMWFSFEAMKTKALEKVMKSSRSWVIKELETILESMFLDFLVPELHFQISDILDLVNGGKARFRLAELKEAIEKQYGKVASLPKKHPRYAWIEKDDERQLITTTHTGRVYTWSIDEIVDAEKLEALRISGALQLPEPETAYMSPY